MSSKIHFLEFMGIAGCATALLIARDARGQPATTQDSTNQVPSAWGLPIERILERALPGYRLSERRLSAVGIGYHYLCRRAQSKVVVTIGVFATGEEALAAAELSHRLMPDKPSPDSGIADQAWVWQSPQGSAIRFRRGRCLFRIGGAMPLTECRALAQRVADQLSFEHFRVQDAPTNEVAKLRVVGLGSSIRVGLYQPVELALDHALSATPFVTGVWMSDGIAKPGARDNDFRLRASGQPRTIMVRCFATFADNFVLVETRQVQLTKGG